MAPKVCVLVSSYNGADYLAGQLDSLVSQTCQNVEIIVRDDGSTDNSPQILREYAAKYPHIHVEFGENIGIAGSFMALLSQAHEHCQYFAFCDQDDVWYPDKLERALLKHRGTPPGEPALYFSRLEYVGRNLAHLKYSRFLRRRLSFQNALVENNASGCTIVLNRSARDMIVSRMPSSRCIMHDQWCYLVVMAFGKVIYDEQPTIKYRLHGGNDTGAAISFIEGFVRRVRRFTRRRSDAFGVHAQAVEFERVFGQQLSGDKRAILERFIQSRRSVFARCRYAFHPDVYRQSRLDDVFLRALLILGWY
ncbi:MAG TPA: glycosyltransferase family 2 protein [Gammaproteobacteria bacterium]|nr:glycosyltransferase family 2 protein [Gammaproteobacteria bacterium]